jgi:hypothetical protein
MLKNAFFYQVQKDFVEQQFYKIFLVYGATKLLCILQEHILLIG